MGRKVKVVLDTNIVVSAQWKKYSVPADILTLALDQVIQGFISDELFEEYTRVLHYPRLGFPEEEVDGLLADISKNFKRIKPKKRLQVIPADESDNRVLECAVSAKVNYLITGNTRHFTFLEYGKVKIVIPRQFIEVVWKEISHPG